MSLPAFPGLPRDRAGRIAYFESKIRSRRESDPLRDYKELYSWANPDHVEREFTVRDGKAIGLSNYHELMRRTHALRAWCAQKAGWRNELRCSLFEARAHRRLAAKARREER